MKTHCIAKAYGGEPLERYVVGTGYNLIYVVSPMVAKTTGDATDEGVGFPIADVFVFESKLFARMRAAYDAGNVRELAALWSGAQPLVVDA
ncbi:MAG: hypothetical protein ACHQAY_10215 [Hyphomicrobiales bacterium]